MKHDENTNKYTQMGIAALLPGMQFMVEQMQRILEDQRLLLSSLQNGQPKRRGRTPQDQATDQVMSIRPYPPEAVVHVKSPRRSAAGKHGWAGMTAEERSAEMKRRVAARHANLHPRDARHPEHDQWIATMKRVQKKRWAAMTLKERAERQAKMQAGKAKKES